MVLDRRTIRPTPERGARIDVEGHSRRRGSKGHAAADKLCHLLAPVASPADGQDRAQVAALAAEVHAATGEAVELSHADQGEAGAQPAADAVARGIWLEVVRLPAAKRGFALPPRRRVVERNSTRAARFRRPARDGERLPETVAGLHLLAFTCQLLHRLTPLLAKSP